MLLFAPCVQIQPYIEKKKKKAVASTVALELRSRRQRFMGKMWYVNLIKGTQGFKNK